MSASADKPGKAKGTSGARRAPGSAGKGQKGAKAAAPARTSSPPKKTGGASRTRGAANRRGRDNLPHKRRGRATLMDRVHRARVIAAERAKVEPTSWKAISDMVGLAQSQCREIYADFLRWDETMHDPMAVVDETIDCLWAAMIETSDTAANADPGSAARVGAIRAFMEAATTRLALMQAAGKVPRYLGTFQAQAELQAVLREFGELLRKHAIEGEALRDFLELAERVQSKPMGVRPAIEGTVTAA